MRFKHLVLLLLTIVGSVSVAKGRRYRHRRTKPDVPYKYYYTQPVDFTPEWTYMIPECQSMSKDDYKLLSKKEENCKANAENSSEACLSLAEVELRNSKTNEKKSFGLNYIIYGTMKACQDERAKLGPLPNADEEDEATN